MARVKVVSYNVCGLCSPNKRNRLWLELRRLRAQVLFLQETHFTDGASPKLPTHLFPQWYLSNSPKPKSQSTAIAIHKSCPFQPIDHYTDPQGRYVFLKGSIMGQVYTFSMLYAPNSQQLTFVDSVLDRLADFREGKLVLGRDFNISPYIGYLGYLGQPLNSFLCFPETLLQVPSAPYIG